MLILNDIVKDYVTGDTTVRAMKHTSVCFRESEFVAILGPSGCGKTTMLNIIGGLDQYTSGDLIINGRSTKTFKDSDWDTYRNHSIGFVFQSYNLIPHQTILANVELALTLSGVSPKERRERAIAALERVGLGNHIDKRPAQLSGGQMQRVSIARALINDPDIILADEPTGALDSETSVQIMELLKEISNDKLIIMVTHNPELAYQYANRIINCLDGEIVGDSNPFEPAEENYTQEKENAEREKSKGKKPSMSYKTAFLLSLRNLITKRGRTIMVAFAGSIGIIGIALVLALSTGINNYIAKVESDALLMFPLSVEKEATNTDSLLETAMGLNPLLGVDHDTEDAVYINQSFTTMLNSFIMQSNANNLKSFKQYIDDNSEKFASLCNDIQFNYSTPLNIYRVDGDSNILVNPNHMMEQMGTDQSMESMAAFVDVDNYVNLWKPLVGDSQTVGKYYDVIYGRLPENYNEVVLLVDGNNEINEMTAYALGLNDQSELMNNIMQLFAAGGETETDEFTRHEFDELLSLKYKLVLNSDYMVKNKASGLWTYAGNNPVYVSKIIEEGLDISIVGIIRPSKDNVLSIGTSYIGYLGELQDYAIEKNNSAQCVQDQLADLTTDILTGEKFFDKTVNDFDLADIDLSVIDFTKLDIAPFLSMAADIDLSEVDLMNFDITDIIDFSDISDFQKKLVEGYLDDAQVLAIKQAYIDTVTEDVSLENTFSVIGYSDEDNPTSIFIYPKDFETKAELSDMIDFYNESVTNEGHEELAIEATDYIGIAMNLATQFLDTVTYTLVIFVAISLVVSSIMIGIITYVSVIERTKEIGILRAIGASKRDVSNVFNAETIIIGLTAGGMGILITLLLEIPINLILHKLTGISVAAMLPVKDGLILICISMFLTFISGLVPSRIAANKDPVECLRSE